MRWQALILVFSMAACNGGSPQRPEPARFDLGPRPVSAAEAGVIGVEVSVPSWLAGTGMQYRLLFAEPSRRLDFAESAWTAAPAELLRQSLAIRFGAGGKGRCRLHVDLDEFAQLFDSAVESRFVVEGRVALSADQDTLSSRRFSIVEKTGTADARGGVAAAAKAVGRLEEDLGSWAATFASRCRV
jgi:cholesterol transport system auxiliary component